MGNNKSKPRRSQHPAAVTPTIFGAAPVVSLPAVQPQAPSGPSTQPATKEGHSPSAWAWKATKGTFDLLQQTSSLIPIPAVGAAIDALARLVNAIDVRCTPSPIVIHSKMTVT